MLNSANLNPLQKGTVNTLKLKFISLLFTLHLIAGSVLYAQTYIAKFKPEYSAGEVAEKVKSGALLPAVYYTRNATSNIRASQPFSGVSSEIGLDRIVVIKLTRSLPESDLAELVQTGPFEYIELNKTYKINGSTNDSLFAQQWALNKIQATKAWDITTGSDTVVVGIVDTGIDYLHPDLKNKIKINEGETGRDALGRDKKYNGIDDDGNGFVDDWRGWDFTDRDGFPFDSTGGDYLNWDNDPLDDNIFSHGTAVAGIIAAETNNGIGVAAVAPTIKVLVCRAFDPDGFGEEDDVAAAILYAAQMGAKVINMSFGDYSYSYVLRDVIRYAYSKGVVLVASSGNSNSQLPHYPSAYSEVISVGNSTKDDYVSSNSNYGSRLDLVAPGTQIVTTVRNGKYAEFNGTSAAAPFVSAAAALILSRKSFSNENVKQILKSTCDDIEAPGWDPRSGSGRLNVYKAISTLAPARVTFDYPRMDFATSKDTIKIKATVLSPFFERFSLSYGLGLNPKSWTEIIPGFTYNQVLDSNIATMNIAGINDTALTLRIVLYQNNGGTLEERINVHKITKAVKPELITLVPAYYGNSPTILSAFFTEQNAVGRMYYVEQGGSAFKSISLDGFATNNRFVKQLHYGFIPRQFSYAATPMYMYWEFENQVGMKTRFPADTTLVFRVDTDESISNAPYKLMPFKLKAGAVAPESFKYKSDSTELLITYPDNNSVTGYLNKLSGTNFVTVDSIKERIVKDIGDFNNNGKKDILANWGRSLYILEQSSDTSAKFVDQSKIDNNNTWPMFVADVDFDRANELFAITGDSSITEYSVRNDMKLDSILTIRNFSKKGIGGNLFDYPAGLIIDTDNNGRNELWALDSDGDIVIYDILSRNQIVPDRRGYIATGFAASSGYITSGDFNGDGKKDIAVILHSVPDYDVASFHRLFVFNYSGNKIDTLLDRAFVDPAGEFGAFTKKAYNSIKFADLDGDGKDELSLVLFPYAYVFSYKNGSYKPIFYAENASANTLLITDLNKNRTPELVLPLSDGIYFYEFTFGKQSEVPSVQKGFSISAGSAVVLGNFSAPKTYLLKGNSPTSLSIVDSLYGSSDYFIVSGLQADKEYYFAAYSYDSSKTIPLSERSVIIKVFHHLPASASAATQVSSNSVKLSFNNKIAKTIADFSAFSLRDSLNRIIEINSITPMNEYSYLITSAGSFGNGRYSVTISGLTDNWGAPVNDTTLSFNSTTQNATGTLFVSSFKIQSPYLVELLFNKDVDPARAGNTANYVFSPDNAVSSVSVTGNKVLLNLAGNKPVGSIGREYRLEIRNLISSSATGNLPLIQGAGSVLLLTGFAEDLSSVYVYPSPATLKTGVMTFANLPKKAEIHIFSLSGKKLVKLEEKDGNGGLQWNLIDEDGKQIPTGVYYYKILQLTDTGDEKASKTGKFTVVQ